MVATTILSQLYISIYYNTYRPLSIIADHIPGR